MTGIGSGPGRSVDEGRVVEAGAVGGGDLGGTQRATEAGQTEHDVLLTCRARRQHDRLSITIANNFMFMNCGL